ncbi:2-dehydro-3-deoxy-6-phosphogalactonate aldolase [Microbulbifer mangrovi]|uniref:2-dehydro-3-deoxy-6-phosphogalactonate aldolase n=1 Tax=Microbulbifer mangrovi TaxID=927787 RepID=UPI00099081BE|nr:2-dehydro-3-deoxy-6-phosphogalactonate aldolase [Microbulbifer mangrovi]
MLTPYLEACPLVAILRGVTPQESVAVAELLAQCGFSMVEVPLNSPDALDSIRRISDKFGNRLLVGAGTVTDIRQVHEVAAAGGRLVVSPNCDPAVINETKHRAMVSLPGCCTPSEVFRALALGADAIKLFPASMISPQAVKALRAVLPPVPLFAVGGIEAPDFAAYIAAGVDGFGTGSGLYRPGMDRTEIRRCACKMVATIRGLTAEVVPN